MDDKLDKKKYLEFVYSFHKTMREHEVLLIYEGDVTHQITKAFTSLVEGNMIETEENPNVGKKVFHVMVECLQNISKHADGMQGKETYSYKSGAGVFKLSKETDTYTITTGNLIATANVPNLKNQIDTINNMDKEGLKEFYKKKIKEVILTEKGGAGLGLIDIAKKTGSPLNYDFIEVNDKTSFFIFSIQISKNN